MFPAVYGILSQSGALWTPAQPTTDGGVLPHTWEVPGVSNFQDAAKTTPAGVGDVVGAVVNQGSDTHDIVQATTDNKPTLQQATVGSVTSYVWRFDGANDYLQGAFGGGVVTQPYTLFVVEKLDASVVNAGDMVMLDGDDSSRSMRIQQWSSPAPDSFMVYAGTALSDGASNSTPSIFTILWNGGSSQLWLSGVSAASGSAGTRNVDGITVGALFSGTFNWKGDIGQILIYSGNLSTADKNQVGEYLERVTGIAWTTIT